MQQWTMKPGCVQCQHLFGDLADATRWHVKVLEQSRMAAIEQNADNLLKLEPQVVAASHRRDESRKAFKNHEATHDVHTSEQLFARCT
jgi:hypothetical protein